MQVLQEQKERLSSPIEKGWQPRRRISADDIDRIRSMAVSGMKLREIAYNMKISVAFAFDHVNALESGKELVTGPFSDGERTTIRTLVESEATTKEVARELGRPHGRVCVKIGQMRESGMLPSQPP